MESFDEWFNTYENLQCDKDACEDAFEAGQQSKQAEVDELQLKLSEDSRVLHNVIDIERRKCEELQKRIDEALKELEYIHFYKTQNSNDAIKILKGNSHES